MQVSYKKNKLCNNNLEIWVPKLLVVIENQPTEKLHFRQEFYKIEMSADNIVR